MKISLAKKWAGLYCCAYGCSNEPDDRKGGLCHKHYARKIKERDPVYVRYNHFIAKAKSRGVVNTVTLEEFRRFCQATGYIITKGKRGQNATIDRRCNHQGYHIWNMTLLTNRQNAKKGNKHRGDDFTCPF
jgi:hypothetical protein